jgi:hypothetical protein
VSKISNGTNSGNVSMLLTLSPLVIGRSEYPLDLMQEVNNISFVCADVLAYPLAKLLLAPKLADELTC